MLIVYNKQTGEGKDIQVSNSEPNGALNVDKVIEDVVKSFGGKKDDYGVFRLHDVEEKEITEKVYTNEFTITNNKITFGSVKEIAKQEIEPTPNDIMLASLGQELTKVKFELMTLKGGQ